MTSAEQSNEQLSQVAASNTATSTAYSVMEIVGSEIAPFTYFQDPAVREVMVESAVDGDHILIGGPPGGGKTTIAKALAATMGLRFDRFQGDPKNTSRNLLGRMHYHPGTGEEEFIEGKIFTDILLADEITRNGPEIQTALIEAMAERQVSTFSRETRSLSEYFMVLATTNYRDSADGILQLSQQNRDRFPVGVDMSEVYSSEDVVALKPIVANWEDNPQGPTDRSEEVKSKLPQARADLKKIRRGIDPKLTSLAQELVLETRSHPHVDEDESVLDKARAAFAIERAAANRAARENRLTVREEDILARAPFVIAHRVELNTKGYRNTTPQRVVAQVLGTRS